MKYINITTKIVLVILITGFCNNVFAVDSSSSNYLMEQASISSGGDLSSSSNYSVEDSVYMINTGTLSGTTFNISSGYQQATVVTEEEEEEEEEEQSVCNSNGICEAASGETTTTCPSDCPLSGGIPSLFGTIGTAETSGGKSGASTGFLSGSFKIDQGYMEIKNVVVSSTDKKEVKVTWQTNKSVFVEFIVSDEKGEEKFRYVEPRSKNLHEILIPGLDLTKKYYFRILISDLFGNNNYEYSDLYKIEPRKPATVIVSQNTPEGTTTPAPESKINYNVEVKNQESKVANISTPAPAKQVQQTQQQTEAKVSYFKQILNKAKDTLMNLLKNLFN